LLGLLLQRIVSKEQQMKDDVELLFAIFGTLSECMLPTYADEAISIGRLMLLAFCGMSAPAVHLRICVMHRDHLFLMCLAVVRLLEH